MRNFHSLFVLSPASPMNEDVKVRAGPRFGGAQSFSSSHEQGFRNIFCAPLVTPPLAEADWDNCPFFASDFS
jgi:hypothetical protein